MDFCLIFYCSTDSLIFNISSYIVLYIIIILPPLGPLLHSFYLFLQANIYAKYILLALENNGAATTS